MSRDNIFGESLKSLGHIVIRINQHAQKQYEELWKSHLAKLEFPTVSQLSDPNKKIGRFKKSQEDTVR